MTVRRHAEENFNASQSEIASAIRWVLSINPPYHHTRETVPEAEFKTKIKPNMWFLSTEMIVQLKPRTEGVHVIADTRSQWFILGDYPDFYNRYLRDFLRDIRVELQRKKLHEQGLKV